MGYPQQLRCHSAHICALVINGLSPAEDHIKPFLFGECSKHPGDGQRIIGCDPAAVDQKGPVSAHCYGGPQRLDRLLRANGAHCDLDIFLFFFDPHRLFNGKLIKKVHIVLVLYFQRPLIALYDNARLCIGHLFDKDQDIHALPPSLFYCHQGIILIRFH